ncbi:hypothetical protein [Desulfopila sp. IMCC35008]|uniref:hypothetical protein n=1 Tax=Desulfopila sp. IMCC35008 TaxID=2653858 RepID=UPI0013D096D9|nr:hypothetical protein [Desulfopila sp. IMCC35008]
MSNAHQSGVKLARAGKFDEALTILHSLHQDDPENREYIYDLDLLVRDHSSRNYDVKVCK